MSWKACKFVLTAIAIVLIAAASSSLWHAGRSSSSSSRNGNHDNTNEINEEFFSGNSAEVRNYNNIAAVATIDVGTPTTSSDDNSTTPIIFSNQAWVVARFKVQYVDTSHHYWNYQTNLVTIQHHKTIQIPNAATEILLQGEYSTGLSWVTLFSVRFPIHPPAPPNNCFTLQGTLWDMTWDHSCLASSEKEVDTEVTLGRKEKDRVAPLFVEAKAMTTMSDTAFLRGRKE